MAHVCPAFLASMSFLLNLIAPVRLIPNRSWQIPKQSIHPSTYHLLIHVPIHPCIHVTVQLHPSIQPHTHPRTYPVIHAPDHPPNHYPSIYMPVHLSIYSPPIIHVCTTYHQPAIHHLPTHPLSCTCTHPCTSLPTHSSI